MTLPTHGTIPLSDVFTRYGYAKVGGSSYRDNKYKERPLLQLMTEHQRSSPGGGANIVHPVNLGTSANGKSLSRNETFSITGNVNETWARYQWAVNIETIFVSWWDIREAAGNSFKMESLLDTRIDETRENMNDTIVTQLSQTTAAESTDINPILSIIATTGETGGINPATSGQEVWAAENEDTINWQVEGVGRTRELKTKLTNNKGMPDVVLLPETFWNETCEIGDASMVTNTDAATRGGTVYADLGLQVPIILGMPVIQDPAWTAAQSTTGVVMDLSAIHLVCDPRWDMYMWPFKDMAHHGRFGQASVQVKVCQNTTSARRNSGSLTTIS